MNASWHRPDATVEPGSYWQRTEGQRANADFLDKRAAAVVNADWLERNRQPFGTLPAVGS